MCDTDTLAEIWDAVPVALTEGDDEVETVSELVGDGADVGDVPLDSDGDVDCVSDGVSDDVDDTVGETSTHDPAPSRLNWPVMQISAVGILEPLGQ